MEEKQIEFNFARDFDLKSELEKDEIDFRIEFLKIMDKYKITTKDMKDIRMLSRMF